MTITKHELRLGRKALLIWTASIAFFLALCVFMYPSLSDSMGDVTDLFSSMGSFTSAFGMDRLNFGTLIGFYAVECGNILSVGGAFFAAMLSIAAISKEQKERTAEFLVTHPLSRERILAEKLLAVILQVIILNAVSYLVSAASIAAIGEEIPWKEMNLLHGAYFFVQIELCLICFGISAFIKSNGFGLGIGIATVLYFMNIIANISDKAKFLKYFTPFGYADGADLVADGCLDFKLISLGLAIGLLFTVCGFVRYHSKNLQ